MPVTPTPADAVGGARLRRAMWPLLFVVATALIVWRNLAALGDSPPGTHIDEASIGYNAWALAHNGVDEHGAAHPLFFEAFGEYKNPVYIYALAGVLRVLPLTATIERLPAAGFGLAATVLVAMTAWTMSKHSRAVTLASLIIAALTPWLIVESRVGFEVISMVVLLTAALWCLVRATSAVDGRWWFLAAGCALAVAIFAYTTARLGIGLLAIAVIVAFARHGGRHRRWWWMLPPIAVGYSVLVAWALAHPGALTARFDVVGITADASTPLVVMWRFIANYLAHIDPFFLFISGDSNPRNSLGLQGMLMITSAPLVLAGIVSCWRERSSDCFARFLLLGLLLSPIPAALTNQAIPHAVRAAAMLPFLLVLAVRGLAALRPALAARHALLALAVLALAVEGAIGTVDLFSRYPARAGPAFDIAEVSALQYAHDNASGHTVFITTSSPPEAPYIEAAFLYQPNPPPHPSPDSAMSVLASLGMQMTNSVAPPGERSGDLMLLGPNDPLPPASTLRFDSSGMRVVELHP